MTVLNCLNPDCTTANVQLRTPADGHAVCQSCGQHVGVSDAIKPYAKRTASWIIAGTTFSVVGFINTSGTQGWVIGSLGAVALAYALVRVGRQFLVLKKSRGQN